MAPVEGFTLAGTQPFGCLLVHGFTATPEEMRPLGVALAQRGFPVSAVRLPGHGTSPEDLERTTWLAWVACVDEELTRLRAQVPRVAIAGMSMGALLALHAAATRTAAVDALVLCGTPITPPWGLRLLPLLVRLPGFATRYRFIPKHNGPDISDPAERAATHSYDRMPLHAVLQFAKLQAAVRAELKRVTQPALLMHGRHDHSIPIANLGALQQRLASAYIETHVFERSWHVITLDVEREQVAVLAAAFLARVAG